MTNPVASSFKDVATSIRRTQMEAMNGEPDEFTPEDYNECIAHSKMIEEEAAIYGSNPTMFNQNLGL